MILKVYKELLILLVAFILLWFTVSYLKFSPKTSNIGVSIEQEEKLAIYVTKSMSLQHNEIHNRYIDSCVLEISRRLENAIDVSTYKYTFHIIDNQQVNAFASLGGHIYIHSGLIEELASADELTAILAHEVGHVECRHVINKVIKEIGLTLLFSMFSGNDPILVSEIIESLVSNAFDRRQESEADKYGLNLLEKASVQPLAMAHAFQKLKNKSAGNYIPELISSHPNINARIRASLNYKTQENFTSKGFDIDWEKVQKQLAKGNTLDYH